MIPTIEMLRNWSKLPAGVKLVEEKLTCNLFGYERRGGIMGMRFGDQRPCQGTAEIAYRYYVVGDMKIPSPERPRVLINADFWRTSPGDMPIELTAIQRDHPDLPLVSLWVEQGGIFKTVMILTTDIRTPSGEQTLREGERPDYLTLPAER